MRTEVIDPPSVARYILSAFEEHCSGPLESGNLIVQMHGESPDYGIILFDDRIAISGYNPDSGTVQVLLDTDTPEAREWAISTDASYRGEARPIDLELDAE